MEKDIRRITYLEMLERHYEALRACFQALARYEVDGGLPTLGTFFEYHRSTGFHGNRIYVLRKVGNESFCRWTGRDDEQGGRWEFNEEDREQT